MGVSKIGFKMDRSSTGQERLVGQMRLYTRSRRSEKESEKNKVMKPTSSYSKVFAYERSGHRFETSLFRES